MFTQKPEAADILHETWNREKTVIPLWLVSQLVSSIYTCKWFDISSSLFWSCLCVHEKYHWQYSEITCCVLQISFFWVMRRAWLNVPFWIALLVVYFTPLTSYPTSRWWWSKHYLMYSFNLANVKNTEHCQKQTLTLRYGADECKCGNWGVWRNCSLATGAQAAAISPPTFCHLHR